MQSKRLLRGKNKSFRGWQPFLLYLSLLIENKRKKEKESKKRKIAQKNNTWKNQLIPWKNKGNAWMACCQKSIT